MATVPASAARINHRMTTLLGALLAATLVLALAIPFGTACRFADALHGAAARRARYARAADRDPSPLWPDGGHPIVIAHRGGDDCPENSLAAIESAARDGADYAEIDVRLTADGEVVVFHDRMTGRLSADGRSVRVADLTLAQLRRMPMVSRGGTFVVPTLDEAIRTARASRTGLGLLFDMKTDVAHAARLARRVAAAVRSERFLHRALFMSTDPDVVRALRRIEPGWRVGLCCRSGRDLARIEGTRLDFMVVTCAMAGEPTFDEALRRYGARMVPVYAGLGASRGAGPGEVERYLRKGVDGVLGDDTTTMERAATVVLAKGGVLPRGGDDAGESGTAPTMTYR